MDCVFLLYYPGCSKRADPPKLLWDLPEPEKRQVVGRWHVWGIRPRNRDQGE